MNPESRPRKLTFLFDYISHNAYISWTQLDSLARRFDLEVETVPVLFGGLLNAHGGLGPAEIPAKSLWMIRDVIRKAKMLGVPLAPPASHPFNPLVALRVTCVAMPPVQRHALIEALFAACWTRGRDISKPEIVTAVLDGIGLDGAGLVAAAATAEVKARLREHTDSAVQRGVFGVPTMMVGDQLFWGHDDWPHLERYLRGEEPLTADDLDPWLRVKPGLQRRRPQ